jgi:hypothetical protein
MASFVVLVRTCYPGGNGRYNNLWYHRRRASNPGTPRLQDYWPRQGLEKEPLRPKFSRAGEACRIIEEYANALREIIEKLRQRLDWRRPRFVRISAVGVAINEYTLLRDALHSRQPRRVHRLHHSNLEASEASCSKRFLLRIIIRLDRNAFIVRERPAQRAFLPVFISPISAYCIDLYQALSWAYRVCRSCRQRERRD